MKNPLISTLRMRFNPCLVLIVFGITLWSCKHDVPGSVIDPTPVTGVVPNNGICFEADVLPIFQSQCSKSGCHDAASREDGYQLDSYANIIRKGLVAGNAAASKLYKVLVDNGSDRMPPPPNAPLTSTQIATIAQWINEGARNTINCATGCDTTVFTYSGAISSMMQTHCTGCHNGAAPSGGGISLSTYAEVRTQALNGKLLRSIDHTGPFPMPKNSAKLSDCKITQVRKWINAGAPNN